MAKTNILPTSPEDKRKLKNYIVDIVEAREKMQFYAAHIKDVKTNIKADFTLQPKLIGQLITAQMNQNIAELREANDEFDTLYTELFESQI